MIVGGSVTGTEIGKYEMLKSQCCALGNSLSKIEWNLSNTGWKAGLAPG
jgi:hypothetical protein